MAKFSVGEVKTSIRDHENAVKKNRKKSIPGSGVIPGINNAVIGPDPKFKDFLERRGLNRNTTQTGFLDKDIAEFARRGNTAASNSSQGLLVKKTRTDIRDIAGQKIGETGATSSMTGKSDAEINNLINIFQKRRNLIKERRRSPGLSQTKLLG